MEIEINFNKNLKRAISNIYIIYYTNIPCDCGQYTRKKYAVTTIPK
jgi:hypothetical protein